MIDKLAFLHIENGKLLLARSRGKDTYYIPGGKREAEETDEQALIREIKEELSVDLIASTLQLTGIFEAQADGKPEGTRVTMTCYTGVYRGMIEPAAEIEEVAWYREDLKCSAVTQMIVEWLQSRNIIDSTTLIHEKRNPEIGYDWVLFDADETLFRFDDFRGLKEMFSAYGVVFSEEHYRDYKKSNEALWKSYQNGEITAEEIRQQRFSDWSKQLHISPEGLNSDFLMAMSRICEPLEGAISLLDDLKGKAKLGIITNGFTEWQEIRLECLGLKQHIDLLVTSEQAGVAKPNRAIFDHALEKMGNPERKRVLMVGDNLHSDILGGINAELDTCWLNLHNKDTISDIAPTYQVFSFTELAAIFFKKKTAVSGAENIRSLGMFPALPATPKKGLLENTISSAEEHNAYR